MSELKLVIGNKNYSSWSLRPWFFMKNLGIDFEEVLVHLFENNMEDKLAPYFSNNKVPVLIDGDTHVWDSLAIIETIADIYPEHQGWPKDNKAKAIARSISAEMHSSFFALRDALPMNCKNHISNYPVSPEVQTDIDRVVALWEHCKQNYGKDGAWLFGEFSGADAMFAPIILRFSGYDVKLSGFAKEYSEMVLENMHIESWIEAGKAETQIIEMNEV
jgi:glutathione S-transferase